MNDSADGAGPCYHEASETVPGSGVTNVDNCRGVLNGFSVEGESLGDGLAVSVATADPEAGIGEDEIASRFVEGDIAAPTSMCESRVDFVLHVITDCGGAC